MSGGTPAGAPSRLRLRTPRLVLRSWRAGDAAACKQAIDSSLERLQPWLPWAHEEPSPLAAIEERLVRFERDFVTGADWYYGCFASDGRSVLGGVGLHPRRGPGILEIGYWIRTSGARRGYASEAAAALTRCAFERHGIARVEIRCDPDNQVSALIPRRLGFRLRERLTGAARTHDGQPRDSLVFELAARDVTPGWAPAYPVVYEEEEAQ